MNAVLDRNVLVLNKSWMPINVTTVFDAVCSVFGERAKIIDPETCVAHDFESWVENWSDAAKFARVESDRLIRCPRLNLVAPEIILCAEYKGVGFGISVHCRPKFSRRNIFARDRRICQYCGKKFDESDLNVDHVVPRSRGGKSEWTNVVLSCVRCNDHKADRLPAEAGMRLVRRPEVPSVEAVRRPLSERLRRKIGTRPPKSWEAFLGKMVSDMYWEVELRK